jgi:hypothetical protein
MAPSKKKTSKLTGLYECPYCLEHVPSLDNHMRNPNGNCRAWLDMDSQPVQNVTVPYSTSVPPPLIERSVSRAHGDYDLVDSSPDSETPSGGLFEDTQCWGAEADEGSLFGKDDSSMVLAVPPLDPGQLAQGSDSDLDDEGYQGDRDNDEVDVDRRNSKKRSCITSPNQGGGSGGGSDPGEGGDSSDASSSTSSARGLSKSSSGSSSRDSRSDGEEKNEEPMAGSVRRRLDQNQMILV